MLSPIKSEADPLSPREKLVNAAGATVAILALGLLLDLLSHEDFVLPVMASMGASAFLLFVVPHSPMAQPWPLMAGHALAALIAAGCVHALGHPVLAAAAGVGGSILAMQFLRCLHPPAAATALAVALGNVQGAGALLVLACAVIGGTVILLGTAVAINNLLLGRRYPMKRSHHPHHAKFQEVHARDPLRLEEEDIEWALGQMDGIVDASREDLIDIYELALEHARVRTAARADVAGDGVRRRAR